MTDCILCNKPAEKDFIWFNQRGDGTGSGPQGGAMCEACMSFTWDALDRFPQARATVTIFPLGKGRAA